MAERDLLGIATTAKLGSHPLHPMLIPFPIALLVATLVCDVVYWLGRDPFWAQAAFWALGAGIAMAALAALAGIIDFFGNARIRALGDAWKHMIGNVAAVLLSVVSFGIRYGRGPEEGALPAGLALSAVVGVLLLYTGWKGGNLVYHHRIGMHPESPDKAEAAPASGRS